MKTTEYFALVSQRPDRTAIRDEWIVAAVQRPIRQQVPADGHLRR